MCLTDHLHLYITLFNVFFILQISLTRQTTIGGLSYDTSTYVEDEAPLPVQDSVRSFIPALLLRQSASFLSLLR